ncbi:hypothetical protein [Anaerotignum sp.]
MRYLLWLGGYGTKNSFTWAEIGVLLKEFWWLVALFFILFVSRAYLLHREYKWQKEEQMELERQRELYGDTFASTKPEKEEKPSYEEGKEDICIPKQKIGEKVVFQERNKATPKYEWRFFPILLAWGVLIGMGGSVGGMNNVLLMLFVLVLLCVVIAAKHLPANWVYTSFDEDKTQKKIVNWKGFAKEMIPYGAALLIGILFGLLQQWLIRR